MFYKKIIAFVKSKKNNLVNMHDYSSDIDVDFITKLNSFEKHKKIAIQVLLFEQAKELTRFFKYNIYDLENIINNPTYKEFKIPKKKDGFRIIQEPEPILKSLQKQLNYYFQGYYLMLKPKEVTGFVINPFYINKSINIVENAKFHVGKKHLMNIDIKDFFSSVKASKLKYVFTEYFGYNNQIATAFTLLTSYKGCLPTGAPTSPVLSNFVCLNMDMELKAYCKRNNLAYSRYADDLSFSSNEKICADTILDIISIINYNGYEINKRKFRINASNTRQTVTGITVNQKINVKRSLLKNTRAMLYDMRVNGHYKAAQKHFKSETPADYKMVQTFVLRLKAYIDFIGQVRGKSDKTYSKFKKDFDDYTNCVSN